MLTHEGLRAWYGWAELYPGDPIIAGSLGRWRIIYHVGRYGLAAGGSLRLLFPAASDWPALQGRDPYDESFVTVTTSGRASLAWRYEARGHAQPWPKALTVDLSQAGLGEGDTIVLYLGDPEGGSPGVRAQTFCQPGYTFPVLVDPFASGRYVAVPSPSVDIIAGSATLLEMIVPSQAGPGAPFALTLRLLDRWGNPAAGYAGQILLHDLPALQAVYLTEDDQGAKRVPGLRLEQPGIHRLRGREPRLGLQAESNPIRIGPIAATGYLPLWGDLAGQARADCDAASAAGYFRQARDVAALDFCSHQADARRVTPAFWQELQEVVQAHEEPGRFTALLGYRWAGATAGGGSRHLLFRGGRAGFYPCGHITQDENPTGLSRAVGPSSAPCYPLPALYQALRGGQVLLIASAGCPPANPEYHDPELDALVEVYSAWGEAPWLLTEALQRGHRVGFVANSGSPDGGEMVGRGGLTCAYAGGRSRGAIWQALRAGRCYATSGARILLDVQADGHTMGESYRADHPPRFQVRVSGTAEIERVEIRRGLDVAYRYPEHNAGRPGWLRVVWGGALARDWPRHLPWDGSLRLHGGRIRSALPYGFHSPARGIVLANEQSLSWRSLTAGNKNGLLLEIEAAPEARLEIYVPLANLVVPLAELPFWRDLGGEGLHLCVEPLFEGTGQRDLDLEWTEESPQFGVTPYYVMVLQADGARAWSSPIYVER